MLVFHCTGLHSLRRTVSALGGLAMTILLEVLSRHRPPTVKGVEVLIKQLQVVLFGVSTEDGSSRGPVAVHARLPNGRGSYLKEVCSGVPFPRLPFPLARTPLPIAYCY